MKQYAPATTRNRAPIRDVLGRVLPANGSVLEIASGSGEHAIYFAAALPRLQWQPSDPDPMALASIEAWRAEAALPNVRAPIQLDAAATAWPVAQADAVVCCNMIHISPWDATLGLVAGSARVGAKVLVLYGPYLVDGQTAASNLEFDRSLRNRDPRWGVRELREVEAAALAVGWEWSQTVTMPANNLTVIFERATVPG